MKKRILAFMLTVMLMAGLLPMGVLAADATSGTCGENVTWSFDEASGTLTISGTGEIDGYYDEPSWKEGLTWEFTPWRWFEVQSVVIEAGVTRIGHYTFNNMYDLETVTIPNTVTSIGEGVFYNCENIKELNIPASLVQIDAYAFENARVLERFVVDENNPVYASDDSGVLFDQSRGTLMIAPYNLKGEYSVPDTVITIGEGAFSDNDGLTKIMIPSSVEEIGENAFGLGQSLNEIYVDPANKNYNTDDRGVLYNKDQTVLIKAPAGLDGEYVVPATVKEMGKYSLAYCQITSLIISDGVELLGPEGNKSASVNNCENLVHTKISNKVQTIPTGMYNRCSKLASVDIPDSVVWICGGAFGYCESLTGVFIPVSVKTVEDNMFWACSELKDVYYEGTEEQWNHIAIVVLTMGGFFRDATIHYNTPRPKCSEGEHLAVRTLPVEAGCESGWQNGTHCCVCGEVVKAPEEIPGTGHQWNEDGFCSVCGEEQKICAHSPVSDAAVAATCTTAGLTEGSHCSKCNEVLTAQEVIPATGHKPETVEGKAATCTEEGLTDGSKCANCGEVLEEQTVIPAKGHTELVVKAEEATCTAAGKTEGKQCSVCGKVLTGLEDIPATGHKPETVEGKAATCTEEGLTDGTKCSVCDEVLVEQEPIPALGHKYSVGKCTVCGAADPDPVVNPFTDVAETDWFFTPVLWAVENSVTGGTSATTFGPDNGCTRAQVVTFLWAANGKPTPNTEVNPFTDISASDWYYKAVLWAVENGITGGIGEGLFGPHETCTRGQIVTFLWASQGKPAVSAGSTFSDVADTDWYAKPVIWAGENNVTGGIGDGMFGPNNTCTRGQVVTFLYKVYG